MRVSAIIAVCLTIGCSRTAPPPAGGDGPPPAAAAPRPESAPPPTVLQEVLASKCPADAAEGFRKLFRSVTADDLRRLQADPSDTVAIQAAWQEVELTVPPNPDPVVRPDRAKLARFLGFLEERGRLKAPAWWAEAVLDARANRRWNVYAGGLNVADHPKQAAAARPPARATFGRQGGRTVVRVGEAVSPVPDDLPDRLGPHWDRVSALITPARCYVAAHDWVGYPYRLACVDRGTGKTRWVAEVWASWWYNATGVHRQWVEVTEQGDRVVVFGVASTGFHAEAFGRDGGANVFRFSNAYVGP